MKKFFNYMLLLSIALVMLSCESPVSNVTISYDSNGGMGTVPSSITATDQELISIASGNHLTKVGYDYLGWSSNSSATKATYKGGESILFVKSTVLYAVWKPKTYTISYFDVNGGSGKIAPQTVYHGIATTLSDGKSLTKTGYYVYAWSTKADGTGIRYIAGDTATFTSNDTLYAVWSLSKYTLTYEANGGIGFISSRTFSYENSVTLSDGSGFSKIGNTFIGWGKDSTDTTINYIAGQNVQFASNITLYAKWKANTYNITYNSNGGSGTIASQSFIYGNSLTLSNGNGFYRAGYKFIDWNTKADGTGISYAPGISISFTNDITLYARWVAYVYVTYYSNGGTSWKDQDTTIAYDTITIRNGSALSRDGYTFIGWDTDTSATTATYTAGQRVRIISNTTLYAVWKVNSLKLTYNLNEGSGTTPSVVEFSSGNSLTLSNGNGFYRAGYKFIDWNTKADGTGTSYAPGISISFTNDITLYARWVANVYVTYYSNGGTSWKDQDTTIAYDSIIIKNGSTLSRAGYTFIGWNTDTSATTATYTAGQYVQFASNTNLYAIWKVNSLKLTYNLNGGSGTPPSVVEFSSGNSLTLSNGNGFYRAGYKFIDWNTKADGTGTSYAPGISISFTNDITLYARWVANVYVTYYSNGGTSWVYTDTTTAYDSIIIKNGSTLSRAGYTFIGWNTDTSATTATYTAGQYVQFASNTNLYAIWKVNSLKLTYNLNGGSGTPPSVVEFSSGNSLTLSNGSGFYRAGYKFIDWNTKADGTGISYAPGISISFTNDITLYARWAAYVYVTYYSNGGTSWKDQDTTIAYDSITIRNGSALSRAGYTFIGWDTDTSATTATYTAGQRVRIISNTTLYAIWVTNLRFLISKEQFNTLTPHKNYYATDAARYWGDVSNKTLFSYENLEKAALMFPKFLGEGDKTTRLKELAAFFANTSHETTGGWGADNYEDYSYTNTRYGYGYCFPRELDVLSAANTYYGNYNNYQSQGTSSYAAVSGQYYYGRGPIQTSYPYNYGPLSNDYFNETDGHTLLNNPDLILQNGVLFWYAAIRFWMNPSGVKPSCHGAMIGNWDSETSVSVAKRNANNLTMGFGLTVNIINGGLEAGNKTTNTFFASLSDTYYQSYLSKVKDRQGFYKTFCTYMGINYSNDNLDCGSMYPFNQLIEP